VDLRPVFGRNRLRPRRGEVATVVALGERTGWGKDYADALTYFEPLFDSHGIIPRGNPNYSLVGITPAQCAKLHVQGDCRNVPNVDARIARCSRLSGQPRLTCWEGLDRTMMTKVVPWVPYLWSFSNHITSSNVSRWSYDQFGGLTAWAHVALK
jgi:hypothetical protein